MKKFLSATLALLAFAAMAQSQDEAFRPAGLQRITIASTTCTGFHRTPSFKCTPTNVPGYLAKANTGDNKALVIVSHGSGGLDKRHSDYAQELAAGGINALVLGHWEARGLSRIHLDYASAREKGGTVLSQAVDVLAAASSLKQLPEWKDTRIGFIGESLGGSTAIGVTRPYIEAIVKDELHVPVTNVDASVALYPGCDERNTIERFKKIPVLIIAAELDDDTPANTCVRYVDWMNERGGQAEITILPGQHHDFDAPYKLVYSARAQNPAKCSNLRDNGVITLESTGKQYPNTPAGGAAMYKDCYTYGLHSGHQGNPKTGYDVWMAYFKKHLLQ
jgi:dienelactone hydrolase